MADKKPRQHANNNGDHGNSGKGGKLAIELRQRHLPGRRERLLNHVIERAIPGIDGNAHLHLEIGGENDERRTENGPARPSVRRVPLPETGKEADRHRKINVKPDEGAREENKHACPIGGIGGCRQQAKRRSHAVSRIIPEQNRKDCPQRRGPEEQLWDVGKKETNMVLGLSALDNHGQSYRNSGIPATEQFAL